MEGDWLIFSGAGSQWKSRVVESEVVAALIAHRTKQAEPDRRVIVLAPRVGGKS